MALISIYEESILHIMTVPMPFFYRSVRHISIPVSGCPLCCLGMVHCAFGKGGGQIV